MNDHPNKHIRRVVDHCPHEPDDEEE